MRSTLACIPAAVLAALTVLVVGCDGGDDEEDVDRSCKALESGKACTWMGLPLEEGFNGDGLHRRKTIVSQPQDLLFMPDGNVWFTDFNNFLIRRVLPDDTVETMVGSQDPLFPGDGPLGGVPPGGAAGSEWLLNHPTNLVQAPDDSVLVVAWHNHKLLTVDPSDGFVTVMCGGGADFAGDGGPAAMGARFRQVQDATYDEAGNLYLVDQGNHVVRRIDAEGIITTIAGDPATLGYAGDGGPAADALFSWEVGSNPNPSGGILHHAGKLYISDTEANVIRVMDLETGMIDGFAGTGEAGYGGDGGPARQALLRAPRDLELGPDGHLYFADTDNDRVRAIDLESGVIRTVIGTGERDSESNCLAPTDERLCRPFGIAFDPEGNLYVADTLYSRIVKVAR